MIAGIEQLQNKTAAAAWKASLIELDQRGVLVPGIIDPTSVGSNFGSQLRSTTELLGFGFTILNPRSRFVRSSVRPVNRGYAIANAIWVLSGENDLRTIGRFNSRGRSFSDDGETLYSAPGWRIFSTERGDQFAAAADRLRADPSSRRAIIQITFPEDILSSSRDISCVISLQFFIRGGRLVCVTQMRSQSALMVLPYDIFLFTMIQEAMAVHLGCELGTYHHFAGSFHYYQDEKELVGRVIRAQDEAQDEMPPMQNFSNDIRERLRAAMIDLGKNPISSFNIEAYELDDYWSTLLTELVQVVALGTE